MELQQEELAGDTEVEPEAAPQPSQVDVAQAAGLLSRAVADLDSLVSKERLDARERISKIEERIEKLEQLVSGLVGEQDGALGSSKAGKAPSEKARPVGGLTDAPRRKKVKRERVKRKGLAVNGAREQSETAAATEVHRRRDRADR